MWPNPPETADLVSFSEEIFNGKLYFYAESHENSTYTLVTFTIYRMWIPKCKVIKISSLTFCRLDEDNLLNKLISTTQTELASCPLKTLENPWL